MRKISFPLIVLTKRKLKIESRWSKCIACSKKWFWKTYIWFMLIGWNCNVCCVQGWVTAGNMVTGTLEISCFSTNRWRKERVLRVLALLGQGLEITPSPGAAQLLANGGNRSFLCTGLVAMESCSLVKTELTAVCCSISTPSHINTALAYQRKSLWMG